MPRTIHLAIFSNGPDPPTGPSPSPPSTTTTSRTKSRSTHRKGKLINVTGNPATAFFLELCRGYDFDAMRAPEELVPLAEVRERSVADTSLAGDGGGCCTDTIARDRMESVATGVRLPGRSEDVFGVKVCMYVQCVYG